MDAGTQAKRRLHLPWGNRLRDSPDAAQNVPVNGLPGYRSKAESETGRKNALWAGLGTRQRTFENTMTTQIETAPATRRLNAAIARFDARNPFRSADLGATVPEIILLCELAAENQRLAGNPRKWRFWLALALEIQGAAGELAS